MSISFVKKGIFSFLRSYLSHTLHHHPLQGTHLLASFFWQLSGSPPPLLFTWMPLSRGEPKLPGRKKGGAGREGLFLAAVNLRTGRAKLPEKAAAAASHAGGKDEKGEWKAPARPVAFPESKKGTARRVNIYIYILPPAELPFREFICEAEKDFSTSG